MNHKRNERRLCRTTLKTTEVVQIYLVLFCLQPLERAGRNGEVKKRSRDSFHQQEDIRRCVGCGTIVNNDSLGGHRRKSALGGPVWCLRCC